MANYFLIDARKQAGLSQVQVAEKIGVSKVTVIRWEQAKSHPYRFHQKKLCELYHKTEQELGFLPGLAPEQAEALLPSFDSLIPVLPQTPLIGRKRELALLKASLLGGKGVTLSALNGLPGVGKTALAIALAHDPEVRAHFKDGILWAGLGPNPDISNHLSHWGALLGLPSSEMCTLHDPQAWAVVLRRAIGSQTMLLIIDDAWTLEDALTFNVGGSQCAHLVTTRFPGIAMQSTTVFTLQELDLTESLALLGELAPRAVEQERDRVGELVKAVGGLPLALHLVGNHLRKQASTGQPRRIHAALQRLNDAEARLRLSEPQIPAERHPSLQEQVPLSLHTVIGVTIQQLDEPLQEALFALSLFSPKPETFSESAALAVAACTVEELDALADSGLLESSGTDRYTLHQTISDYARLHLKIPEVVQSRLIAYTIDYLQAHQKEEVLLGREIAIIFAALEGCKTRHRALLQIVELVAPYLHQRGLVTRIEPYLHEAYEVAAVEDASRVAIYLEQFAWALIKQGKYEHAKGLLLQGLELARRSEEEEQICLILKRLGVVEDYQGNYGQAEIYHQEGLQLARTLQKPAFIIPFLINLSIVAGYQNDLTRTVAYSQEALELTEQSGINDWYLGIINNLIVALAMTGQTDLADQYLQEALERTREGEFPEERAALLLSDYTAKQQRGDSHQAFIQLQEVLKLYRQLNNPDSLAYGLTIAGQEAKQRGEYAESEAFFLECLAIVEATPGLEKYMSRIFALQADLLLKRGAYSQVIDCCQKGLALDSSTQIYPITHLSLLHATLALAYTFQQGQITDTIALHLKEARKLSQELTDPEEQCQVWQIIGETETILDLESAEELLEKALEIAVHHRLRCLENALLIIQGERAIKHHQLHLAEQLLARVQLQITEQTYPETLGRHQLAWGEWYLHRHQGEAASTAFQESMRIMPKEHPLLRAKTLFGLARVAAMRAQTQEARQYGQACLSILETLGYAQDQHVRSWLASLDEASSQQPSGVPTRSSLRHHPDNARREPFVY